MPREHETVITKLIQPPSKLETPGRPCLVVMYPDDLGKRYFLDHAEQIIGRSDAANIQVEQESVSRHHAKITVEGGRSWLRDLDSTNGTFVNDRQVHDWELSDGDLVRVGSTVFKYLSGGNIESKYHEEIYRLTTVDGLTQAYNKRHFMETLERELDRACRYGRVLSLVMFDIDHFKRINDTHGHLAGDHVLRELAAVISRNVRREDVFARYGGEEFALVLPEIDTDGAVQVSEKLRRLIERHDFTFAERDIPVTISLGVHSTAGAGEPVGVAAFIAAADGQLYRAKQSGRNRVCA